MRSRQATARLRRSISRGRASQNISAEHHLSGRSANRIKCLQEVADYLKHKRATFTARKSEASMALQLSAVNAALEDFDQKRINGVVVYLNSLLVLCQVNYDQKVDERQRHPNLYAEQTPPIVKWLTEINNLKRWIRVLGN